LDDPSANLHVGRGRGGNAGLDHGLGIVTSRHTDCADCRLGVLHDKILSHAVALSNRKNAMDKDEFIIIIIVKFFYTFSTLFCNFLF